MTEKTPWGANTPWPTKSSFFTYLRGCLRRGWSTNPIKLDLLKEKRKQIPNPNPKGKKKTVWGCTCSICKRDFVMSDIQVDHIVPAGNLNDVSDIQGFVERLLYITKDDLRIVCKGCNHLLAYADKHGITLEEAVIEKEVIRICKEKLDKEFFIERGLEVPSNVTKRRDEIRKLLREEYL